MSDLDNLQTPKEEFPIKYLFGDNQNTIEKQIWGSMISQLIILFIQRKAEKKRAHSNYDVRETLSFNDLFKSDQVPEKPRGKVGGHYNKKHRSIKLV